MNTCVIWPSVASNKREISWQFVWRKAPLGPVCMGVWSSEETGFFYLILLIDPCNCTQHFGEWILFPIRFFFLHILFIAFSFTTKKHPERLKKKYQLGLVKYLFHSVRCFMNWTIYVTELIFIINTAVVFIWEILWLKMTHVYLTELFYSKHSFCV